ncbi:MAG TPA: hypothetical protein PJ990_15210 [Saprospiraceae bacterium]|nr:hypothetical protein [Saprospiraceae bacterium]
MNINRVLCLLFVVYSTSCSVKKGDIIKAEITENKITCSLELSKDSFLVGDEIDLFFVIRNYSDQKIYVDNRPYGPMYSDGKNKVLEGFEIQVENEKGISIEQNVGCDMRSGRFGITKIDPMHLMKIRIHDIFKYGITKKEGIYKVTINRNLDIYMNQKQGKENGIDSPGNFEKCIKLKTKDYINVVVS